MNGLSLDATYYKQAAHDGCTYKVAKARIHGWQSYPSKRSNSVPAIITTMAEPIFNLELLRSKGFSSIPS